MCSSDLTVFQGSELAEELRKGSFLPASGEEILAELETLLENLEPKKPMIFDTTHPTNIIKIKGTLPQDRKALINKIKMRRSLAV